METEMGSSFVAAEIGVDRNTRVGELSELLERAATFTRRGHRAAALEALRGAIEVAPDDLTAHRRYAAARALAGDIAGAAREYERYAVRADGRGDVDAARLERAYATELLPRLTAATTASRRRRGLHWPRFTADQVFALRRVALAAVVIAATVAVMLIAGSQILARV
ncbi:MAG TPA: hypothetical protein VF998_03080 [Candidatus Limnocylindria bacterium]